MKVRKILLSVILAVIAIMLIFSTNTFAATGSWKLGVEKVREGITLKNGSEESTTRYSYQMTTSGTSKPVLKIVERNGSTANFDNAIYCLKAGQGFGSDSSTISDVTYNTYYDMITEKSSVNRILSLTDDNYGSVLWLLDNIYLPKQTPISDRQQARDDLLGKAFASEFSNVNSNFFDMTVDELFITDDDIEVVQQWALWYFTNMKEANHTTFSTSDLPKILVNTTGTGTYNNLSDTGVYPTGWADPSQKTGQIRQLEAEILYKYLITEAANNSNYSKQPTAITLNSTNPTVKNTTVLNTSYIIVGPFEITKSGNTAYTFDGTVTDVNGKQLVYTITNSSGSALSGIRTLSEAVGNGSFYLKIEKSNLTSNNIEGIKLHISYTTNDTKATFWTVNGSSVDQPVVVIERNPNTVEDEVTVNVPEFDLALRKYIVGVTRNGVSLTMSELTGRTPNVNKTNLKTSTNNKTATTAEYKHKKNPVPVETGDLVNYVITVYNEGEVAGRATKIIDYLPEGLEFYSSSSTEYNFSVSSNKRQITITPKATTNLAAYNGTTLASTGNKIAFTCVVTKKQDKSTSEDTILTNIAEITEAYDENNVKMYLSGDDRDSVPNNLVRPTDNDLPDYKGNSANKSDLSDSTYHYQGQEDDDDFEKLKVTTPEFDLALRKFITHIDGKAVTSREPVVDTTPLKNGTGTTAIYTHSKNPLTVGIGSVVRYTIRIYNESDVAGYPTVIEDYLPAELELVPASESTINSTYGWVTSGRIVTTTYLNGKTIPAYSGGDTLSYKDVQIECRVKDTVADGKILTNIAQINEDSGDDRDSTPKNVTKPTDINLPSYAENQEDDDDYEKIITYRPGFDLALRKFITKIGDKDITGREPVVDTTPLKNKTNTTAIYIHPKDPLVAEVGKIVRYTIRVYNEGESEGKATIIEDYLPTELELVPASESTINAKYKWVANGRIVTTDYLKDTAIPAYDGGDTLHYADVEIECLIKDTTENGKILTNIAQINGASRDDDRDSTPKNVTKPSDNDLPNYAENQEDDDDYEKVITYKPGFDLALRKFITHINGNTVSSREPIVDTTPLKEKTGTTAIYTHSKEPLVVKIGETVRYTIRVYNEGEKEGKATVIEDYLPEELEFVPTSESTINAKYGWTASGRIVTTDYLKNTAIAPYDGGDTLNYADVEIECKVKDTENVGKILTNIAQINDDDGDDRDSTPKNVIKPSDNDLPNYAENQEDDDDYEKVIIYQPEYDLALRKFITKVNDKEPEISRVPVVDVTPLKDKTGTTAIYKHPKDAVVVENGDIVVYTIRVYNEGKIDAYAQEIKDNIPDGLEYIIDNEININYRWKLSADEKQVSTDYLSKERDENNVIKAFDSTTMETLDYKDVQIAFKVVEPNTSTRVITNIAEIKQDDGKDIDSTPDNDKDGEDDIDEEHIKLRYFDLALRKFITKVESKTGETLPIETDDTTDESREPKVEIGEDGKIKYIHPKDPVIVANSDVVIYTLRVYNEGTIDGYADEIKDDVPVGLELIPDHEINIKYGWIMYDDKENVTDDVQKAKTIRTTYLSEQNGEENIIKAFDRVTMQTPAYKEVQVAFKVVEKNVGEERIVINTAEISKDSNDDIDSTPDNDDEEEDDLDKEYIKLKYFDLSLLKWVNKVMITENGQTKVTETGYNGTENPEPIVKIEVKPNQMKSIVIKYEYGIKITNEGQIAGYAKEIADYIPEGLEFVQEDNPLWTLKEDGKIVTTQLEDKLLQPGESAIVTVIFKWKNGNDNFGVKENWAEISKDYNDKDAEDIDSTPDNRVKGEDDIDNALVILNPKTGAVTMFIVLPTIILMIFTTGIVLIKKYVL